MSEQERRLEEWRKRLDGFVPGETSIRQWCRQRGISEFQFHYWRRRLSAGSPARPHSAGWLAVQVREDTPSPTTTSGGVRVRVGSVSIELDPGFDPAMLRAVVGALEVPVC